MLLNTFIYCLLLFPFNWSLNTLIIFKHCRIAGVFVLWYSAIAIEKKIKERIKQTEIGWKVLAGLRLGRGCGVSTHTTGLDGLGDQCSYQSYCTSFPAPPVPLRARTLLGLSRPPYPIRVPCGRPRWAARSSTYSYQSAGSPEAGLGPCMFKLAWNSVVITAWSGPNFGAWGLARIVFARLITRHPSWGRVSASQLLPMLQ